MSKLARVSQEQIDKIKSLFNEALSSIKRGATKFEFKADVENASSDEKAKLVYTPMAWAKLVAVVEHFKKEVGWHSLVRRVEGEENVYEVYDILVFPQQVTSVHVDTDQEEYQKWLVELTDEQFDNMRGHGHSHVDMGTSPSGTDTGYQSDIINGMGEDTFYVFEIWNKKHSHWVKIVDLEKNIIFEDKDVTTVIGMENEIDNFIAEADKIVKEEKTSYTGYSSSNTSYGTSASYSSWYESYYGKQYESNKEDSKKEEKKDTETETTEKEVKEKTSVTRLSLEESRRYDMDKR